MMPWMTMEFSFLQDTRKLIFTVYNARIQSIYSIILHCCHAEERISILRNLVLSKIQKQINIRYHLKFISTMQLLLYLTLNLYLCVYIYIYMCVCVCVCVCVCILLTSAQSCPTLQPHELYCSPPGSSVHGIFPGKNTEVGCHFLLQGIFPTQGLNPHLWHLQHWEVDSLLLVHPGSSKCYFKWQIISP